MKEIILDTETTGLDPKEGHRIIEIGLLEVKNKVLTGRKFHKYVNPQRDIPMAAYKVHGISREFLEDKPLFEDIVDEFLEFISGGMLVIHNAAFDMKFINHELSLLMRPSLDMSLVTDTLSMARKAFPGAKVNLDALCKRLKIDNSHRTFHGALLDAEILYEVYVELSGGRQNSLSIAFAQEKANKDANALKKIDEKEVKPIIDTHLIYPTTQETKMHQNLLQKIPGNIW
jgi:DNA polymerase-3 subunit epsilon